MVTEAQITAAATSIYGEDQASDPGCRQVAKAALEAAEKAAWQPIAEGSPPFKMPVLVCNQSSGPLAIHAKRYAHGWIRWDGDDLYPVPTHWRPLPAPPTESF